MSPRAYERTGDLVGFPRVSGDEPQLTTRDIVASKFSPRERG